MRAICGLVAATITLLLAADGGLSHAEAVGVAWTGIALWCLDHILQELRELWRRTRLAGVRVTPALALPSLALASGIALPVSASARIITLQALLYAAARPVALHLAQPRVRTIRVALLCSNDEAAEVTSTATGSPEGSGVVAPVLQVTVDGPAVDAATRLADLSRRCRQEQVDVVLVGSHLRDNPVVQQALHSLHDDGVRVAAFTPWFEQQFRRTPLAAADAVTPVDAPAPGPHVRALQRAGTVTAALPLLVVLLVLLPLVAAAIAVESGRPVFFRQLRVGLHKKHFQIVKFRTMRQDAEVGGAQFACEGDCRVTRVGRFLRRTRIDELPQVLNILRGDMTLIGPRPERPEFVAEYERCIPGYDVRHVVRPGVTGWAQVTEGYTSSVEGTRRKLERDLFYVKHRSRRLNALVVARTFGCVARMSGR